MVSRPKVAVMITWRCVLWHIAMKHVFVVSYYTAKQLLLNRDRDCKGSPLFLPNNIFYHLGEASFFNNK